MPDVLLSEIDPATPTSSSTVVGETGGVVKRFATSDLVPFVNVKHYGAVGDGVTDDTAAIQAAVTAGGENATIHYPAGTYKVASSITLTPQQHHEGAGAIIAVASGVSAFVRSTDGFPGRVRFSNLRFQGTSNTGKAIAITNNTPLVEIENCYFSDFLEGVRLDGSYCSSIKNTYFSSNNIGVVLMNEAHSSQLVNVFCDANVYAGLCVNGDPTNGNLGTTPIHNITTVGCAFQNSEFGVWAEECLELHLINTYHEGNTKADLRLGVGDAGAYARYCYNFTVDGWQSSSACASGKNIIAQHAVNGSLRGLAFNSGTSTTATVLEIDGYSDKIDIDYHRIQTGGGSISATVPFDLPASRCIIANNGRRLMPEALNSVFEFGTLAAKKSRIWQQSVSGRDGIQIEALSGGDVRLRADTGGVIRFEDAAGNLFFYVDISNNKVVFSKAVQTDGVLSFNGDVYGASLPVGAPGVANQLYVDASGFVKRN